MSDPMSDESPEDLYERLRRAEKSVHSQHGEDGVLECLFDEIGVVSKSFVEFGAGDGVWLSNTAHLRTARGWTGLLMEGSERADGELVKREFVNAENIELLLGKYDVPRDFDLLSIDIDGNDYWVWRAIEHYRPRVVVMEYNIFFALDAPMTMPYDPDHVWDESVYHGASLAALHKLADEKGYALVYTGSWAPNAFFVRRSELPEGFVERPLEALTDWCHYDRPPDARERPWQRV